MVMKTVGELYYITSFEVLECGMLNGREFMVIDKWNGGRAPPGGVEIAYRNSSDGTARYNEDNAPKVMYLGKGSRRVVYEWPGT
jgi:hypothetical protein